MDLCYALTTLLESHMEAPKPDERAQEIDPALVHLDDDELEAIKVDLEQRLARFQKAFFQQHGRNPNEEERAPAKPAIKKYRGVGAEIARRQKMRAQLQANKRLKSAIAVTELAVGASQDRPSQLVRSSTARAAIQASEKMARFTSTLGGSATLTLFFEWGQYTAIWADVSLATALMIKEQNPGINLGVLGSWIGYLEGTVWRWVQIFNLDIEAFRANFDIAFLAAVGWREVHLLCTVIVPFLISGVTVLLLKSLGEIARLALLTSAYVLALQERRPPAAARPTLLRTHRCAPDATRTRSSHAQLAFAARMRSSHARLAFAARPPDATLRARGRWAGRYSSYSARHAISYSPRAGRSGTPRRARSSASTRKTSTLSSALAVPRSWQRSRSWCICA